MPNTFNWVMEAPNAFNFDRPTSLDAVFLAHAMFTLFVLPVSQLNCSHLNDTGEFI